MQGAKTVPNTFSLYPTANLQKIELARKAQWHSLCLILGQSLALGTMIVIKFIENNENNGVNERWRCPSIQEHILFAIAHTYNLILIYTCLFMM